MVIKILEFNEVIYFRFVTQTFKNELLFLTRPASGLSTD
jgi:hypothetical protein